MIAISFALGLRQRPATGGIYPRSSSRGAQLPADLCADRFGGAMTAVIGCTKNLPSRGGIAIDLRRRAMRRP
jgi:hypothetical protein